MKNKFLLLVSLFFTANSFNYKALSQNDPLEEKITINTDRQTVESNLLIISQKGNVNFSYNSDIIPLDSVVSLHFDNKEISKILRYMLGTSFMYKTTGQHVVILKKKSLQNQRKDKIIIKGSVFEFGTEFMIADASIYNISGKESALSDENGNFEFTISPKGDYLTLAVNKSNYNDTIVIVKSTETKPIEIYLKPQLLAISSITPVIGYEQKTLEVEQSKIVPRFLKFEMILHAANIKFFKKIPFQLSILPTIGTNALLGGSIINRFSVNVLVGYSYGLQGIEVGGLLNINRKQVTGAQFCGIGNITGEKTKGVQVAGIFNHSAGKLKGVQIAGYYNSVGDSVDGVQISGFANVAKGYVDGAQIAGFINIASENVEASQISGFMNLSRKSIKGIQVSSFMNSTNGDHNGFQVSSFLNKVRGNMDGGQISGFFNSTGEDFKGIQVSGFINKAEKVKGLQLGIINIADTVSVASIGFLNIIKKGLHQVSLNITETGSLDLAVRLGTYRFYNILGVTTQQFSNPKTWGATYGIGTQFFGDKKFHININTTFTQLFGNMPLNWSQNHLYKLSGELNLKLSKRFSLFTGPSFNVLKYASSNTEMPAYAKNYIFKNTFEETSDKSTYKGWLGLSLGLKVRI